MARDLRWTPKKLGEGGYNIFPPGGGTCISTVGPTKDGASSMSYSLRKAMALRGIVGSSSVYLLRRVGLGMVEGIMARRGRTSRVL